MTRSRENKIQRKKGLDKKTVVGAIVEAVRDEVKLVAEQYGDIKKELQGVKKTLDSHTDMIGSMKTDVEIIKEDIEFIKNSLKKKVDVEEFSALERRVSLLEKRL